METTKSTALHAVVTTLEQVRLLRVQVGREEQQVLHLHRLLQALHAPATPRPSLEDAVAAPSSGQEGEAISNSSTQLKEQRRSIARSIEALVQQLVRLQVEERAGADLRAEADQRRRQLQEALQRATQALDAVADTTLSLSRACEAFRSKALQQLRSEVQVSLACQRTVLAKLSSAVQRANTKLASLMSTALQESVLAIEEDLASSLQQHESTLQAGAPNPASDNTEESETESAATSASDIWRRVLEAQRATENALRLLRQAAPERRPACQPEQE